MCLNVCICSCVHLEVEDNFVPSSKHSHHGIPLDRECGEWTGSVLGLELSREEPQVTALFYLLNAGTTDAQHYF